MTSASRWHSIQLRLPALMGALLLLVVISRRGELAQIPLLQKPFEPAQLLEAIRALLDEDQAEARGA